ncbi:gluconokinase [Paeniglutamicibacter sp. ABSL32-1]|uniref:gluconokinase n=1 Tax=Paeniglutamicibacter quisquiliarum TaxID=2849498 RepID=UPI001C2CF07E|nr:gluconokinase [Paeniglutamicibacter quisquiliarum]MBV1778637.1 gluconokinase [Paeniglutamicibacter quisquiliarum]
MNSLANPPMVVMGVSGCGKSTVGNMLALELGSTFIDGDDLHPVSNKEKMAAGQPLDDTDREPWLATIGEALHRSTESGTPAVIACSALKRNYRDALRAHEPATLFIHLRGAADLIQHRLDERNHEYMPSTLLASQLNTLEAIEEDEPAIEVDVSQSPADIVALVATTLKNR